MQAIKEQDWQTLPEFAQQEVYDFFMFIKQRYDKQSQQMDNESDLIEAMADSQADIKAGRFVKESALEHLQRVDALNEL